ncbi:hypothetical protein ES703_63361 [subsurface metagenome]
MGLHESEHQEDLPLSKQTEFFPRSLSIHIHDFRPVRNHVNFPGRDPKSYQHFPLRFQMHDHAIREFCDFFGVKFIVPPLTKLAGPDAVDGHHFL